jgi:large subunit ribosomal protein L19
MSSVINQIETKFRKPAIVAVKSGDSVKVHQKIREGSKERIQIFEGLVIRTDRMNSHTATITVRRMAGGIGVEKSYLLHSPLVTKVEVVKRSKVRRNYLSYMRARTGKSARLSGVKFDQKAVNDIHDQKAEAEEEKLHEQAQAQHDSRPVDDGKNDQDAQPDNQPTTDKPS